MGDATVALRLLLTDDEREALDLARQLQALNAERQRRTEAVMVQAHAQALAQLERPDAADFPIVVTRGEGWPLGLIGLVAGRLAEEFGRPALAVSITGAECRGSARGPAGFNLVEALAQRAELLRYFGGHAQAAGFTLATLDLPALLEHLQAAARQQRDGGQSTLPSATPPLAGVVEPDVAEVTTLTVAEAAADPADAAVIETLPVAPDGRELDIDCQLPLRLASAETYAAIRQLAPYGPGFPVPLFLAQGVRVLRCWRSGPEGRTLRLRLRQGASESTALWSRQGARSAELQDIGLVDVVYTLDAYARPEAPTDHFMRVVTLRSAVEPAK